MKFFLFIILFSFALKSSAHVPLDKYAHMVTCGTIGLSTNTIAKDKLSGKKLFTVTFAVPAIVGGGKEYYDYLTGKPFSIGDLKADLAGALISAVFCQVVHNFKNKPKGQIFFFGTTDKERLERNKNKIDFSNL